MFCTKCGKPVDPSARYCPACGNPVGGGKKAAAKLRLPDKWLKLGVVALAVVLALSLIGRLFGGSGRDEVIPNYLHAIEQQSFSLLKKAVQPEIVDQISPLASNWVTMMMLGEVRSVSFDIKGYQSMSRQQIDELREILNREYGVSPSISEACEVDVYIKFLDAFGDERNVKDSPMRIYKTGGHWYVYPEYSAGR